MRRLAAWVTGILVLAGQHQAARAQSLPIQHVLMAPVVQPYCAAYSADGKLVAVGGRNGSKIYSVATGAEVDLPLIGGGSVYTVQFSPNGKILAAQGDYYDFGGCGVQFFDTTTGKLLGNANLQGLDSIAFAFSPDGTQFAVGGITFSSRFLQIWNTATLKPQTSLKSSLNRIYNLAWSPDGKTLLDLGTSSNTSVLEEWNVSTATVTRSFAGIGGFAVQYTPDGQSLIVVANSNTSTVIQTWNPTTGKLVSSFNTTEFIAGGCFSADGSTFAGSNSATSGYSATTGQLSVWNVATGKQISLCSGGSTYLPMTIALSANGRLMAHPGSYSQNFFEQWDTASSALISDIDPSAPYSIGSPAYSPDGAYLAEAVGTNVGFVASSNVMLWNASTGNLVRILPPPSNVQLSTVAYSSDGQSIADGGTSSAQTGIVNIWNASTGQLESTIHTQVQRVANVQFVDGGFVLAIGGTTSSNASIVEFWNAAAATLMSTLSLGTTGMSGMAISPDGGTLGVSGTSAGNVVLWNLATGKMAYNLPTKAAVVGGLTFSKDGSVLADAGYYVYQDIHISTAFGVLEQWNVSTGALIGTPGGGGPALGGVAYSADGRLLFCPGFDFLSVNSAATEDILVADSDFYISTIGVSPIGTQVAVGGYQGILALLGNPLEFAVQLKSLSLSHTTVQGGELVEGTLRLSAAAPTQGLWVSVFSDQYAASVPQTVAIPAGATAATFAVQTRGVASKTVADISVADGVNTVTQPLTINPAIITSISISPVELVGGMNAVVSINLSGPSDSQIGDVIALSTNSPSLPLPSSFYFPAGKNSASMTIPTSSVAKQQTVSVTATLNGKSITAKVLLDPRSLKSISLSPSTISPGGESNGTVTLASPVAIATTVILGANSSSVSLPKAVTIPAGATSATFGISVSGTASASTVQIKAVLGSSTATANLTIK